MFSLFVVVKTLEGKRSIMNLGERMIKNFAWIMKTSDKLDISQQSESDNNGVRISVRRNTEDGQPTGLIVCASSSLCLPLPPLQVYDLLRNLEVRHEVKEYMAYSINLFLKTMYVMLFLTWFCFVFFGWVINMKSNHICM